MYYKTRHSRNFGWMYLFLSFVFLGSGIPKFLSILVVMILCVYWYRYYFWVLQTRHLELWFSLKPPICKADEDDWLSQNKESVLGRLQRVQETTLGYKIDMYGSGSRHLKEMQVLAHRFGFQVFQTMEVEYE